MTPIPAQIARGVNRQRFVRALRVNVTAATLNALDRACRAHQATASDVIRHVLTEYLTKHAAAIDVALGDAAPGGDEPKSPPEQDLNIQKSTDS